MCDIQETVQLQKIIRLIKEKNFVIYGHGFIGKRFYNYVKKIGCFSHVTAFAVTHLKKDDNGNKNVKAISAIPRDRLIFIAAHDTNAFEMMSGLKNMGFQDYIWIYPYLIDMELGEPIEKNRKVRIQDLIHNLSNSYAAAIYYLSIKDYCDRNVYDGSIYIRMTSHYTTERTAKKRWDRFRVKIDECLKNGFVQDYNIKVLENNSLIDGMHRLILAKYFNQEFLHADAYRGGGSFYSEEGIGGNVFLQDSDLIQYYSEEEIDIIKEADEELKCTSG